MFYGLSGVWCLLVGVGGVAPPAKLPHAVASGAAAPRSVSVPKLSKVQIAPRLRGQQPPLVVEQSALWEGVEAKLSDNFGRTSYTSVDGSSETKVPGMARHDESGVGEKRAPFTSKRDGLGAHANAPLGAILLAGFSTSVVVWSLRQWATARKKISAEAALQTNVEMVTAFTSAPSTPSLEMTALDQLDGGPITLTSKAFTGSEEKLAVALFFGEQQSGIQLRQLGGSGIKVSECGLGTQRWASADFNAPDEALCHRFMDKAVEAGVNLIDTAEQYPIPSDVFRPEGRTEEVIGRWISKDGARREKLVIATKITGGLNVNAKNLKNDLAGSLKRLQTDYVDLYLTHWSFRLSQPQQNWGQSLQYRSNFEKAARDRGQATFEEVVRTMDKLVRDGKIRGWGCCNESPYGATRLVATAKEMGMVPPCVFQNDYSILNRRNEENGMFEMCSPYNENVGFMAYNVLAGGVLTGKYLDEPAAPDQPNRDKASKRANNPRGRMDEMSWGRTLYRYRSGPAGDATRAYAKLAKDAGLSLTELSLRWAKQRAGCTTCLLGQTSLAQLDEDLKIFSNNNPLPEQLMWEIDRIHMRNRLPIFASTDTLADGKGRGEIGESIP